MGLDEMQELSEVNNRLMDGLNFCKKTYKIFESIRASKGGIQKLRLREGRLEKKLIEELLPVTRYVQMKYSHVRKIKVKWIDGNQAYDAYLLSSGPQVERGYVLRKQFLEVTTAVNQKDYLSRKHLNEKGHSWGAKGITQNNKTKEIISKPFVYSSTEAKDDLIGIILERIKGKSLKNYPQNTVLVIQCMFDTPFFDSEWDYIIDKVKNAKIANDFKEIILFDSNFNYFTTLYGQKQTP